MPELPDVEDDSPQRIRDGLRDARLSETRRHGKHLFARADDDGWLRLHFGMTGWLEAYSNGDEPDHTELRIDFVDGSHLAIRHAEVSGRTTYFCGTHQTH